ncbi:hypothetical protein LXD69_12975 [Flavobacterium sediminilitoris]|uniref:GIY-YIG domain-containing protein n=1 Tax=Flavobacterium sediminilitoris TaxID=2024526 RepID=A0ABY4HL52_9FLAO|nr:MULTISPECIES: hypothetical protein [Flavobacterium]UOX32947.1 hypothetical protein LXD69_12975 [Flavobacterium sediminilitoris]
MEYIIEKYNLKLIDAENNSCKTEIFPHEGLAFLNERRKLYVVYHASEIFYVGEAHTSIKTRFQRGYNAYNYYKRNNDTARNGYKGYKWLNKEHNSHRTLAVSVVTFPEEYDCNREMIEAIEGELVYLIRNKFGYWPNFQNEIHFSNCEGALEIAEDILNEIFGELD